MAANSLSRGQGRMARKVAWPLRGFTPTTCGDSKAGWAKPKAPSSERTIERSEKAKERSLCPKGSAGGAGNLARIVWTMIAHRQPYDEEKAFKTSAASAARRIKHLHNQAQTLGFKFVPA